MRVPGLVLFALTACTDPVIELSFRMPSQAAAEGINPSCVTAVDVWTVGTAVGDFVGDCVELDSSPATFAQLRDALVGQIQVPLPTTDLQYVEVLGRRGSCDAEELLPPGELVFYAGATYLGGEQLVLPIDPTTSCDVSPMIIRPVDLLALVSGPTKGDCTAAAVSSGPDAGASIGSLAPDVNGKPMFYQGFASGSMSNGVVQIAAAPSKVGPKACLASYAGDAQHVALSCIDRSLPAVCAGPGEVEAPVMEGNVAFASIDQTRRLKFPNLVFGAVVDGNRQPIQGATIDVDPARGEIVYVEPGAGRLDPISGTATGASGMFIAYTNTITTITARVNGRSLSATIGGVSDDPGATLLMVR